ncbi:glyoxalase [uncultured Amnibacterium sp.]|uniref:glyoxalase n=1 Tax=uncultured Amnibacterium sp. TaxID=1631851 RepID=UPI0035CC05EA
MEIRFIAGFGPITTTGDEGLAFWSGAFGLRFDEMAPDYYHAHGLPGANVFGLWPLGQAAEATFGTATWPEDRPVPQSWLEFEMASPEAVADGERELVAGGHEMLVGAHAEPWGQWTARLQSPEGMLVGLSYMPDFHPEDRGR